jgi:ribonuclease P protein component
MKTARLPAKRRLKNRRLIQSLFERPGGENDVHVVRRGSVAARYRIVPPGRASSASGRSAFEQPARNELLFQFGIAVGRRSGNAVSRNTIKRILHERVRLRQTEIDRALSERSAEERTRMIMMLVYSGSAAETSTVHGDADRVITGLIEELSS